MSTTMSTTACEEFLDDLAAVLDGDEAILARHVDHLSGCDDCRDARHEAQRSVAAVRGAGDDFGMPLGFEEKVMQALPAADPAAEAPPVAQPAPTSSSPAPAARPLRSARRFSIPRGWLAGGALAAAATAVAVVVVSGDDGRSPATVQPVAAWSGTMAAIDRAAADGASGVELAPAGGGFAPLGAGGAVGAGSRVRTDQQTRAELRLADGTSVHLDHATEIQLGSDGRQLVLARGNLVADVAHLENGGNARFSTPGAQVEVLGTRFALSATDRHTSVRVVRGLVRLSAGGRAVEVQAGEEGTVDAGGAPEVAAGGDLVGAIGWSELLAQDEPADEVPAGIGELRAFKPGEKRDRDWRLSLASHKVTVRIVGNVARTEIEETFHNDSAVRLEGVYKFPLPADARIERLALDVDGKMEDGAFVAKERAGKIWRGVIQKATPRPQIATDDIIWVPGPWRDPALLEWQQGGRFQLRIFPIPARGSRTVQLAYTQVLAPQGAARRYIYPLPHRADKTAAAKQFELDVRLSGADPTIEPRVQNYGLEESRDGDAYRYALRAAEFRPRGDLVIEYTQPDRGAELRAWSYAGQAAAAPTLAASKRGGADPDVVEAQKAIAADQRGTALIALRPVLPRWTESRRRDYVILLDSSQSMVGERFTRARRLVAALVGEMDRRDRFAVVACDLDCKSFADGAQPPSAAAARRLTSWLDEIQPAGASDLVAGLDRAAHLLDRDRSGARSGEDDRDLWVLYVGDGMSSVGYRRLADLRAESARIAAVARVSISTVGIGGDADASALATLARAGGGHYLPYVPGQRAELAALSILETTFGVSLKNPVVELPAGLEDVSPAELPTVRAGQELLIAARLSGPVKGDVVLRGTVGGKKYENRFPLALEPKNARGNAFVPRMWAALTIERLELEGRGEDASRIIALSQAYAVLSRYTSLLVLESPAMFRAFGVDRSRPAVEWTGDEDADSVESTGATDFGGKLNKGGFAVGHASGAGVVANGTSMPMPASKPAATTKAADSGDDMIMDSSRDRRESKKVTLEKAPARQMPPPRVDGRRWIPMRREFFRVGSVARFDGVHPNILDAVSRAETSLRLEPNSRERHRALVQALAYAGDLERAHAVASQWLERDRLDAEALGYMADVLARSGRRDDSIRTLSGAVDLQPDDRALHERLAAAFERVGAAERACAHRIALAAIAPADTALAGRAVRCLRAIGRSDAADRLLSAADPDVRQKIELTASEPPALERATGDLVLSARWTGPSDLDLSLIAPDGKRLSWLGGRRGLTADGAGRPGSESLALRRIPAGNYLVEVARTDPADHTPITGTIHVRVLGVDRDLVFDLSSGHTTAGRIAVSRRSRLVPL